MGLMHFEGVFEVRAPTERVFSTILDPKSFSGCLPDVQKLEINSPDEFTAVVRAGVSFIKGDLTLNFKTVEKSPTKSAKVLAHGTGMGSTIDIEMTVNLSESDAGTAMAWTADAKVGGRIASIGQRMINGQAEKLVKGVFDCLRAKLEG